MANPKQTKHDTMLIVEDSFLVNVQHEIEEGFVPMKNARHERAGFTLYTNKDGK